MTASPDNASLNARLTGALSDMVRAHDKACRRASRHTHTDQEYLTYRMQFDESHERARAAAALLLSHVAMEDAERYAALLAERETLAVALMSFYGSFPERTWGAWLSDADGVIESLERQSHLARLGGKESR